MVDEGNELAVSISPGLTVSVMTLNPAVDIAYEVRAVYNDQKTHAISNRYDPGGNGVNVARALERLGVPNRHFGIIAGKSGLLLQDLLGDHLHDSVWIEVPGETRVNSTVIEYDPPRQIEITGVGPEVDEDALEKLSQHFLRHCKNGIAIMTGSIPPGVPRNYYADMVERVREQGGKVVLDATGDILRRCIEARPYLIKPNQYEIEQIVGRSLNGINDVEKAAREICDLGVEVVVVSLGARGALCVTKELSLHVKSPSIEVRSSVGAGDSMVAGIVSGLVRGLDMEKTMAIGVACGSATSEKDGTELFSIVDVEELVGKVEIERF